MKFMQDFEFSEVFIFKFKQNMFANLISNLNKMVKNCKKK